MELTNIQQRKLSVYSIGTAPEKLWLPSGYAKHWPFSEHTSVITIKLIWMWDMHQFGPIYYQNKLFLPDLSGVNTTRIWLVWASLYQIKRSRPPVAISGSLWWQAGILQLLGRYHTFLIMSLCILSYFKSQGHGCWSVDGSTLQTRCYNVCPSQCTDASTMYWNAMR